MKTLSALLLMGSAMAAAQTTYTMSPTASAYAYGQSALSGQAANTYTFTPGSLCTGSVPGPGAGGPFAIFSAFGTGGPIAPVLINDSGTPANSEVVTPSAIVTGTPCGVTVSPAHSHTTFALQSGTAGLQEALNAVGAAAVTSYPIDVLLDRQWYTAAASLPGRTAANIIAAVKGSPSAYLEDVTTSPHTYYVWNGTSYAPGTWTNAVPAVTVGVAAGTSPAISINGLASIGTVQLTTGTATTTGTLYTIDWPTTGSFQYAQACTVTSTGSNVLASFSGATSYASSHATLTVTVTAAPAVSTVYLISYSCL